VIKWNMRMLGLAVVVSLCSGLVLVVAARAAIDQSPAAVLVPSGAVVPHDSTAGNASAMPASFPDQFAWTLFVQINQKAPIQRPVGGQAGNPLSHNALWETWADDPQTFPSNPDPTNPPQWPPGGAAPPAKSLFRPALRLATRARGALVPLLSVPELPSGGLAAGNVAEEVHRNKVAFDYIVSNGLWYQQGVASFFKKAAQAAQDDVALTAAAVNFPRAAIEIKANWVVIDPKDKGKYHWNYNYVPAHGSTPAKTQLLGLVAMHILSKDLPNWFWCTYEHIDNPGRGDYIGIHDSFGADPAHVPSNTDAPGKVYPAGSLSAAVLALFQSSGMNSDKDWGDQWKNYRLKGSQIDYTDATGRPLLLGNSVTEDGFVPTASCITCHARAAVNARGASSFPFFGEQSALPLVQGSQGPATYNGLPDPNWYFSSNGEITQLLNLQTDFVWAIPFKARPAVTSPKP
jgi:hypothetical protein